MKEHDIVTAFETITAGVDGNRTAKLVREKQKAFGNRREIRACLKVAIVLCVFLALCLPAGAYSLMKSLSVQIPDEGAFDYIVQLDEENNSDCFTEQMPVLPEEIEAGLESYGYDASSGKSIYESGKVFETWEAAAQWLDCGLLTSEKLGGIPRNVVWGGEIVLVSSFSADGTLRCVQLSGTNEVLGEDAICQTAVLIPVSGEWEEFGFAHSSNAFENENGLLTLHGDAESITTALTVTTAGGRQVQIATVKHNDLYYANGYYMEGGILYQFSVQHEDEAIAVDVLKSIIDSLTAQ